MSTVGPPEGRPREHGAQSASSRVLLRWLGVGAAGFVLVPWYALPDSVLRIGWLADYLGRDNAPALVQALRFGRGWLWPIGVLLLPGLALVSPRLPRRARP